MRLLAAIFALLGLVAGAAAQSVNPPASGGGGLQPANNLSDLASPLTALGNLGMAWSFPVELYSTNAKAPFFAGDGTITSGQATFSSASASFVSADVGSPFFLFYGGTPTTITAPATPTMAVLAGSNATLNQDNFNCYPRGSLAAQNTYVYRRTYVGSGGETTGGVENTLTTNGSTLNSSAVLHFASVPAWATAGATVFDFTTNGAITALTTIVSTTGTSITMSANAAATVNSADVIVIGGSCPANTVPEFTSPQSTYGAQSWNVYMNTSPGSETLQNQFPISLGSTWIMPTTGPTSTLAALPGSNTTAIVPPLFTTILSVQDGQHVTLNANAGSTVASGQWGYGPDQTTAIAAALTACSAAGGGFVSMNKQYVVNSASLTIPTNCSLGGANRATGSKPGLNQSQLTLQPAIWLNPQYQILMSPSSGLVNMGVFQWGLPTSQAGMTIRIGVDASSSFGWSPNGGALSAIAAATTSATSVNLQGISVIGFQDCIYAYRAERWRYDKSYLGCGASGLVIKHSHDFQDGVSLEVFPLYGGGANSWRVSANDVIDILNSGGLIQVVTENAAPYQAGDNLLVYGAPTTLFQGVQDHWVAGPVTTGNSIGTATATTVNATTATLGTITGKFCNGATFTGPGVVNSPIITANSGTQQCTTTNGQTLTLSKTQPNLGSIAVGNNAEFVTLANSSYAPTATCTWAANSFSMTCTNLTSLANGQAIAATNVGPSNANTILGYDGVTNTLPLASRTLAAASGVSVTVTNSAYNPTPAQIGTIELNGGGAGGGPAYYVADSQGVSIRGDEFGSNQCWVVDQESTGDGLLNVTMLDMRCDSTKDPTQVGGMVLHENVGSYPGNVKWLGGSTNNIFGTDFIEDGGQFAQSGATAALLISGVSFSISPQAEMVGSVVSGKVVVTDANFITSGSLNSYVDVAAGAFEATFSGVSMPNSGILIAGGYGQGNIFVGGDVSYSSVGGFAHVMQLFNTAGVYTWTKPAGLDFLQVSGCGAGGGGGNGAAITSGTASSGGAGGGGGGCVFPAWAFANADVGSTESITVGASGTATAGVTANAATTAGLQGGNTYFGTHLCMSGGGGGQGGASAANSGGGGGGFGTSFFNTGQCKQGNSGSAGAGGTSAMVAQGLNLPAGAGNGGSGAVGTAATVLGIGAGGGGDASGVAGSNGGQTLYGCGAGGGGGGEAATPAAVNGGSGGNSWASGNGSINNQGPSAGATGQSPTIGLNYQPASGSSGGGSVASGTANTGGTGLNCGGGGGGGSTISTGTSGGGGAGGAGWLALWTTF